MFDNMNPQWLNRRSKSEILGLISVTTLLTLAITMTIFAVFSSSYQKFSDERQSFSVNSNARRFARQVITDEVCDTPGCVRTANEVIQSLDEKVNPCDNFYKFACGGWLDKHTIREDRPQVSTISDVQDKLNSQLKGLLNRQLFGNEPKSIKMVKDFYDSCMNIEGIERSGSKPLKNVLASLGGWPVVVGKQWDESKFDWMESLFKFRKLGYDINILITLSVEVDMKNNSKHTIEMDQTSLGVPDRQYLLNGLNDSATKAYFDLMVKSAKKLGAAEETVEQELLKTLNFERTLANYSLPNEDKRDLSSMYHKYTIPELQELVPQINWMKYLNGLIDETIIESDSVIVYIPDFLKKFGELITKTDKRTVANYMMWRVVVDSISMLSKDWKALEQEYVSAVSGEEVELPRWEQCLLSTGSSLGIALSSYYIKHYFKGDSKQKAMEMIEYIRKELLNILDEIDWMDDRTKKQAKEKAEDMTSHIGYPQELLNDSIVVRYYENLAITNENYFNNVMSIKKWSTDKSFSELRKPNVKGEWKKHADAAIVNAYFNYQENSIEFPAGILQKVFFDKDRPHYMNFGGIGYVIGHEITHGFDDLGKQFDKEGNNVNWWDKVTDDKFKEKAKCIIYQYGNYTAENGMRINGVNTQGENIADNGGIKEAYRAYHSWVKDHSPEGKLPGLKYTPSQLFWISTANVWCGKYRPELLKLIVVSDEHCPPEVRVNGPLSNIEEFAKAFECPSGSKMNPLEKCQIW